MALVYADRVYETSTTTGLGTFDLDGAANGGYETFAASIGDGNTCYYCIVNSGSNEWEVGLGTVTDAATDTLSRDTVYDSSNNGNKINFSAGTKQVFQVDPAVFIQYLNDNYPNWDTAYGWGDHAAIGYMTDLVDDTTPQLGGDLDPNGNSIAGDLLPSSDFTYDLGSSTYKWSQVHADTYYSRHNSGSYSNFVFYDGSTISTNILDDHQFGMNYFTIQKKDGSGSTTAASISMDSDGGVVISGKDIVQLLGDEVVSSLADVPLVRLTGYWNSGTVGRIDITSGDDAVNRDDGKIWFYTSEATSTLDAKLLIGANTIFGDTSSDALGLESGSVTISTGDSGVSSPFSGADDLVIEGSGSSGITIATPNTSAGNIRFADPENSSVGYINYNHATNNLLLGALNGAGEVAVLGTGQFVTDDATDALGAEPGSITISTGDSGATDINISDDCDDLVIESDGNVGMQFVAPAAGGNFAQIHFGSPANPNNGAINYAIDNDYMNLKAGGYSLARMDGTNNRVVLGAYNGGSTLDMGAGSVHIYNTSSGSTLAATTVADDLVVECGSEGGISIFTPDLNNGNICFGDTTNNAIGRIQYNHSQDRMNLRAGGFAILNFDSTNFLVGAWTGHDLFGGERYSTTISTGNSGLTTATVAADADDLIIENGSDVGITLASGTTGTGTINFADSLNNNAGSIVFNHPSDQMVLSADQDGYIELTDRTWIRSNSVSPLNIDRVDQTDNRVLISLAQAGVVQGQIRCDSDNSIIEMRAYGEGRLSSGSDIWRITNTAGNERWRFDDFALYSGNTASTESCLIELGSGRTGNGYAYIDLIGDTTNTDFGLRIIRGNTGTNTNSSIIHKGTGNFYLQCPEAGQIVLITNSTNQVVVSSTGVVSFTEVARVNFIHMYKTSDVTLTGTYADVTWNTEIYKNDTTFSHTANSAIITVDQDGWYKVTVTVTVTNTSGTARSGAKFRLVEDSTGSYVVVPGSEVATYNRTVGGGDQSATIVAIVQLSATDTVKVQGYQWFGTDTLDIDASGTTFTMERVA